jgi:hypothetical protein
LTANVVFAALLLTSGTYTVDLLGEPGMSLQDRPITSAEDHAQWLHEVVTQLAEPEVDPDRIADDVETFRRRGQPSRSSTPNC